MNSIYLRYGSYVDGDIVWEDAKLYKPTILRPLYLTKRVNGNDLRDIGHSHIKSLRTKSYELVISANDLINTNNFNYLLNFLNSEVSQYNFSNSNWDADGVTVIIEANEQLPVQYINNHKLLRKVSFNLIQKYPD
ncbi:MAG: hypothetical protein KIT33_15710 [Candidatus Kapabacteria bacterium]|nr:hypothetical protein [Ignavibacteriota bacterium]MCW5886417.1 hypothetical protein [Candidatus Kapabacteria bacterium]